MKRLRERIALWIAPWLESAGGIRFGGDYAVYRSGSGSGSDARAEATAIYTIDGEGNLAEKERIG